MPVKIYGLTVDVDTLTTITKFSNVESKGIMVNDVITAKLEQKMEI
jgi:hypothetical protein